MDNTIETVAQRFKRDGYAIVEDVFDDGLVETARQHIDRKLESNPEIDPDQPVNFGGLARKHPFVSRMMSDDRLVDIVEQVFGRSIVHHQSLYFMKTPRSEKRTHWHQDGAYFAKYFQPVHMMGLWVALDEATPENGCLRVVPGSHRDGYVDHDISNVVDEGNDGPEVDESNIDESEAVDLVLEPGDVAVLRPSILHSAYANTSDEWRRAYVARYIPTHVERTYPKGIENSEDLLLRGDPGEDQQYRRLPLYNPDDEHMHFPDWQAYNEKAKRLNDAVPDEKLVTTERMSKK